MAINRTIIRFSCYLANVNAITEEKDGLKTPLLLASELGHSSMIEMFVESGADLFKCDSNGHSALQLAQIMGRQSTSTSLMTTIGISKSPIFTFFGNYNYCNEDLIS